VTPLTIVRSAVTVALFVLFVVLWVWAWSARRRDEFARAAMLPFDETDDVAEKH
jgi:cytochrome c oxidase cbb3-type subunit 4